MFLPPAGRRRCEAFSRRLLPSPRKRIRIFCTLIRKSQIFAIRRNRPIHKVAYDQVGPFLGLEIKGHQFRGDLSNGHYLVLRDPLATEPSRGGRYHGYLAGSEVADS
jgi:hypothetical protein